MKEALSILIFVVAYGFIMTEKVNKTIVAVLGASLALLLHLVSFEHAIAAVDFNVIFLLVGMMTAVHILSQTGFFEWTAISLARLARGNPLLILIYLLVITAVLSAFLDNVTTIILLVPVTILIMQLLEIDPAPVVIMEAIASNIGGTATLIGDPPNIIIGSQGHLSFTDFLMHTGPAILIIFLVFIATVALVFRKSFSVPAEVRTRVLDAVPALAIIDPVRMRRSLAVLGLIFAGFFLHDKLGLEAGVIALGGSMLMLLVCRSESDETLMRVEWGVIFFFIGMFMMIAALEHNGVIEWLGLRMIELAGGHLFLLCMVILWGSAIFSAILDNIPFVITMVPLIQSVSAGLAQSLGVTDPALIHATIEQPMWWSLALGACLGGNGTLIGASANIVMARISERNGSPVSFLRFSKYGLGFMFQSVILSSFYVWLRYF